MPRKALLIPVANLLVVWCFKDGKPGHENQSAGLLAALGAIVDSDVHCLRVNDGFARHIGNLMTRRFPEGRSLPAPHLLIGAGHKTHLPMLAARRARGGRTVTLMNPSLPRRCFDLCIIPQHDAVTPKPGVLLTRGVLNRIRPATSRSAHNGLILVGGPSAHHNWSETQLCEQVAAVITGNQPVSWTIGSSRRTPATTLDKLRRLATDNVAVVASTETHADWLPQRLGEAGQVWVTEDSVSMVYEALTAGAATGILPVALRHPSRVSRGLDALVSEQWVTRFDEWTDGHTLTAPAKPLDEAGRCAAWIKAQWL